MTEPATLAPQALDTASPSNLSADQNPELGQSDDTSTPDEPWRKVKHKYKANGQEEEVDYDVLVKRAEKAHGAEKRLAEASAKEKSIQSKLEKITGGDWEEFVALTGGNEEKAQALAEKFVWDRMKFSELSDEKKEAIAEKKRADAAVSELESLKQKDIEAAKTQRQVQAIEIVNKEVTDAIAEAEKAGLSPEDVPEMIEALVSDMILHIEYLEECEREGRNPEKSPLSPRDVLRKIQTKHQKIATQKLKQLSAKELRALLTEEQIAELRQSEIDSLYAASTSKRETKPKAKEDVVINPFEQPKSPVKKPNTSDWFKAMEVRYQKR